MYILANSAANYPVMLERRQYTRSLALTVKVCTEPRKGAVDKIEAYLLRHGWIHPNPGVYYCIVILKMLLCMIWVSHPNNTKVTFLCSF